MSDTEKKYRADDWAMKLASKYRLVATTPRKGVTKFTDGEKVWEFIPMSDEWPIEWVEKKLMEDFGTTRLETTP